MGVGCLETGVDLTECLDVVQDPERPAVRGNHQVALLNREPCDGSVGHVVGEIGPVGTVVERYVHTVFGTGVQQALSVRVLAEDSHEVTRRDPVDNLRPAGAVVVRPPRIRRPIVHLVTNAGHVGRRAVVW